MNKAKEACQNSGVILQTILLMWTKWLIGYSAKRKQALTEKEYGMLIKKFKKERYYDLFGLFGDYSNSRRGSY